MNSAGQSDAPGTRTPSGFLRFWGSLPSLGSLSFAVRLQYRNCRRCIGPCRTTYGRKPADVVAAFCRSSAPSEHPPIWCCNPTPYYVGGRVRAFCVDPRICFPAPPIPGQSALQSASWSRCCDSFASYLAGRLPVCRREAPGVPERRLRVGRRNQVLQQVLQSKPTPCNTKTFSPLRETRHLNA